MIRALIRFARMLPCALERLHLQWARAELSLYKPCHPDLPFIICRIAELERA